MSDIKLIGFTLAGAVCLAVVVSFWSARKVSDEPEAARVGTPFDSRSAGHSSVAASPDALTGGIKDRSVISDAAADEPSSPSLLALATARERVRVVEAEAPTPPRTADAESRLRCGDGDSRVVGADAIRGRNLQGRDFADADLRWGELACADLGDASLVHANLERADLRGASLSGAEVRGTYAVHADFSGATMRNADLSGSNFGSANLSGADLRHASARCPDCPVRYIRAIFMLTNLSDADLRGTDLGRSIMLDVNLDGADLRGANLADTWHFETAAVEGAVYDKATQFPPYFDPAGKGMVFAGERPGHAERKP